jgi:hypothetical protein
MRKSRKAMSVRVDAEDYKYLQLLALSTEQTIAGAISAAIKQLEQAKPITFRILKIIQNDGSERYDVTLPYGGYTGHTWSVWYGPSLAGALELLTAFRNEHGYTDERRFALEKEIEVLDLRLEIDTGNSIMGLV